MFAKKKYPTELLARKKVMQKKIAPPPPSSNIEWSVPKVNGIAAGSNGGDEEGGGGGGGVGEGGGLLLPRKPKQTVKRSRPRFARRQIF